MMKKFIYSALTLLLAVLVTVAVVLINKRDSIPPVITFAESDIIYNEGDDDSVLLAGVTAADNKDGDVSSMIMIEQKVVSDSEDSMIVYYAAKDNSNNVTKAVRTVTYIPSDDPEDGRKYKIMMINNLGVENLATVWSRRLTESGHTVSSIGLSSDPVATETIIYVPKKGDGEELLEFFPDAQIQVGSREGYINTSSNGAEVFIVFGINDAELPA